MKAAPEKLATLQPACVSRCLADVEAEPVLWLWEQRLPMGKLNILAGQPSLGKSQLTTDFAARVSKGRKWPDGSPCPKGNVIFISCEDDAADTIKPRLMAAGADCKRVHILDWVIKTGPGDKPQNRSFVIGSDVEPLRKMAEKIGNVKLIVIDPVTAYMGASDSHKNADVRAALAPLQRLAGDLKACVVLISHLNKGGADAAAMARVSGSGAFVAVCRSGWVVGKHPRDEAKRVLTPLKTNIGKDEKTGYTYEIKSVTLESGIQTSRVVIDSEPVQIAAEDVLGAGAETEDDRSDLDEARAFLRSELMGGGKAAKELLKSADDVGISERTLNRAKKSLGVKSSKFGKVWRWYIPPSAARNGQHCQALPSENLGILGNLGSLEPAAADLEEGRL